MNTKDATKNQMALTLSIIIVSWNVQAYLAKCLASIFHNPALDPHLTFEVIVVDSASSDQTVAMIQADFPQVRLLAQTENVGFTRGNNIGFAAAHGRYLFMLNPDTEVIGNALSQMVNYLEQHSQVGIIGCHTLNTDGTTQSTRRRFPELATAFFESTWLQPFAPQPLLDHFYARDIADHDTAEVDWVQGSALMARREVYTQIGGLDELYIMYSEELDWCKRAKLNGWRVVYLGSAQIIHHGGKSSDQIAAKKHIYFQQSKMRYIRKYHGVNKAGLLQVFLLCDYFIQIIIEALKALFGSKPQLRLARIATYWEVIQALSGRNP